MLIGENIKVAYICSIAIFSEKTYLYYHVTVYLSIKKELFYRFNSRTVYCCACNFKASGASRFCDLNVSDLQIIHLTEYMYYTDRGFVLFLYYLSSLYC